MRLGRGIKQRHRYCCQYASLPSLDTLLLCLSPWSILPTLIPCPSLHLLTGAEVPMLTAVAQAWPWWIAFALATKCSGPPECAFQQSLIGLGCPWANPEQLKSMPNSHGVPKSICVAVSFIPLELVSLCIFQLSTLFWFSTMLTYLIVYSFIKWFDFLGRFKINGTIWETSVFIYYGIHLLSWQNCNFTYLFYLRMLHPTFPIPKQMPMAA